MNIQDKTNTFLVAIVALVAVVGIVLQFTGGANLDVSATGEAINARSAANFKERAMDPKINTVGVKSSTEQSEDDNSNIAQNQDSGISGAVNIDNGYTQEEIDQAKQGCGQCAANANGDYDSCMSSTASILSHCVSRAAGVSDPAEQASELVTCQQDANFMEAECIQRWISSSNTCKLDYSLLPSFQCVVTLE